MSCNAMIWILLQDNFEKNIQRVNALKVDSLHHPVPIKCSALLWSGNYKLPLCSQCLLGKNKKDKQFLIT